MAIEEKTIEEKLKEYILSRYQSIRDFSIRSNISNSTVNSILKRGIGNSSVNSVIKICHALDISIDELAEGNIVPLNDKTPIEIEMHSVEVTDILANVRDRLTHNEGLTLDGKPADKKRINSIVQAMKIGEAIAKDE